MPLPDQSANTNSTDVSPVGEHNNNMSVKLPPFWEKHPALWFVSIEAQFRVAGITRDTTQYYCVVSALNSDTLSFVSDIVLAPPEADKYQTLKTRLIAEFSDSEQRRIKAVLSELVLGDDKPSHLLRRMRQLSGTLGEDYLKTLWLQRLPTQTQAILSISDATVDKLALMADKIHETSGLGVEEITKDTSPPSEYGELRAQIAEISKQVERLSRNREHSSGTNAPIPLRRPRSPTPNKPRDLCWYHWKYGEQARKCLLPCKFRYNQEN